MKFSMIGQGKGDLLIQVIAIPWIIPAYIVSELISGIEVTK
jgi:hypothetical protein